MSESKQLTVPERAAVALESGKHEKELMALAKKYSDITEIKNPAGREQAHGAMMELAGRRIAITKAGKEARDDATKFSKAVIEEEKRLVALIEPEESRLRTLRDTWDEEREREKAAKAAAEAERVRLIREIIDYGVRAYPTSAVGKSAAKIAAMLETLEAEPITLECYQEFAGEAEMAKVASIAALREMLAAQQAHEADQARLAEERAQLERERAEAAERERVAALARAEQEAKDRAERERVAAEQRAAQEKAAAELRAQQEAHERLMAEQRAEIARQQAAIDAERQRRADEAARVEREKQAAIAAEAACVAAEERRKWEEAEAAARAEAARVEAERRAAEAERDRRERADFIKNGPGDVEIINLVASHYGVTYQTACNWIGNIEFVEFPDVIETEKAA